MADWDNKCNYVDLINGSRIIYRPFDGLVAQVAQPDHVHHR